MGRRVPSLVQTQPIRATTRMKIFIVLIIATLATFGKAEDFEHEIKIEDDILPEEEKGRVQIVPIVACVMALIGAMAIYFVIRRFCPNAFAVIWKPRNNERNAEVELETGNSTFY